MKIKLFITILVMIFCINLSYAATTLKTNAVTKSIPAGTKFSIKLLEPISTKTNSAGDSFSAILVNDEKSSTNIVLPAGSMIRGSILKIVPNKRLSKGAVLYVDFDHIVTPGGRQLPLDLIISGNINVTYDGGVYFSKGYGEAVSDNFEKSVDLTVRATDFGMDIGEDVLYGVGRIVTVPVCALGGAIGGGTYFLGSSFIDLFKKGLPVEFNQGEIITVVLTQSLDVPLY